MQRTVSRTIPIRLNVAYSISCSVAETETHVFKMAAKLNIKEHRSPQREQIPLVSHLPQPLSILTSIPLTLEQACSCLNTVFAVPWNLLRPPPSARCYSFYLPHSLVRREVTIKAVLAGGRGCEANSMTAKKEM